MKQTSVTYDRVIGFGQYCATAMYLQRHFLRTFSSPLDWLWGGDLPLTGYVDLIVSGFRGFLQKENLEPLGKMGVVYDDLRHDYYRDRGTRLISMHDFATSVPFDRSFAEERAKYDRRIARFLASVRTGRVLLVYQTRIDHPDDAAVADGLRRLRDRFGNPAIDLLVIEHVEGSAGLSETEPVVGARHVRGPVYNAALDALLGDWRLCDSVYGAIRCRGRTMRRCRCVLVKQAVRLAGFLHFDPAARKAARERLRRRWSRWL